MASEKEQNTKVTDLLWRPNSPASEKETRAFWKKLRHFYRTGEKPKGENVSGLSGALVFALEDGADRYPFKPLGEEGPEIGFGPKAPFQLIDILLNEHQKESRAKFRTGLSDLVGGLNELLRLDVKTPRDQEMRETYDFAEELIAFDKMVEMVPRKTSEDHPEARLSRIRSVISTLQKGILHYNEQVASIVIRKDLVKRIEGLDIFEGITLIEAEENAFEQTEALFREEVSAFAELIRAYRIAKLEIKGEYDEDVHDEFFDHFNWHRLLNEELELFHPILLVTEHDYLYDHLGSFSQLISFNQPIKLVVLNQEHVTKPQEKISWEDASRQSRQELGALAISQRNVFTLQAGLGDPEFLMNGLVKGLRSNSPALIHLSIPSFDGNHRDSLISRAANAGRFFPRLVVDPDNGSWMDRFDLESNLHPEKNWPAAKLIALNEDNSKKEIDLEFTYADYKAIFPEKANELMLVPAKFKSDLLVPLNKYLELEENNIYGKIPFIWLKDKNRVLQRAAVPNVWVVSCQERLAYWNFLLEISGGKQSGSESESEENVTKEISRPELDKQLAEMKTELEMENQKKIEKIQEEAVSIAAERLIKALLEEDLEGLNPNTEDKEEPK